MFRSPKVASARPKAQTYIPVAAAGLENFGKPAGTAGPHPPVVVSAGALFLREPSCGKCGGAAPERFPQVRSEKQFRLCSAGLDMCFATELDGFDFEPTACPWRTEGR